MKIDNPDHPLHYVYQRSLNRIAILLATITAITTAFYFLPTKEALSVLAIAALLPATLYLLYLTALILKELFPAFIDWLSGY